MKDLGVDAEDFFNFLFQMPQEEKESVSVLREMDVCTHSACWQLR